MRLKTMSLAFSVVCAAVVGSSAYADSLTGVYVGGQVGWGDPSYSDHWGSTDEGGVAGRPYVGYQFNQYLGVETGYTFFSDNTYHIDAWGMTFDKKISTEQWDVLLKAGMPFGNSGFRGDVKVGAADVMPDVRWSGDTGSWNDTWRHNKNDDRWDVAAGAGVSYFLNKNVAVDLSYLHAFGSNGNCSPDTDFVAVGVSYYFN